MKRQFLTLALAVSIPAIVAAQSNRNYPCTNGNLARRIEVAYATSADVPCEVRYFKDGESGAPQILWRATTQAGYCEAQARDFVTKLQALGWVCSDSGTLQSSPAEAGRAVDDTDSLGAGGSRK